MAIKRDLLSRLREKLGTVELARRLGKNPRTLERWAREGIPADARHALDTIARRSRAASTARAARAPQPSRKVSPRKKKSAARPPQKPGPQKKKPAAKKASKRKLGKKHESKKKRPRVTPPKPAAPGKLKPGKRKLTKKKTAPRKKRRLLPRTPTPAPLPASSARLEQLIDALGTPELARRLGKSPRTLDRWRKVGVPRAIADELIAIEARVTAGETARIEAGRRRREKLEAIIEEAERQARRDIAISRNIERFARESRRHQQARDVAEHLGAFLFAQTSYEKKLAYEAWYTAKEAFRQDNGRRAWRQWFAWIVDEYGYDDYIVDFDEMRDT